jgi:hypothetical protein
MNVITHFPREMFRDETSGIANLDAHQREQFEALAAPANERSEYIVAYLVGAVFALVGFLVWVCL